MVTVSRIRTRGFVLIEALIALLIVSLGALAMAKLESLTLSAAGEARQRSEAMAIAQQKMEQLRNVVLAGQMPVAGTTTATSLGTTATYNMTWTYNVGSHGVLVYLTTSWTDRFGANQSITLNSRITWDNPLNQSKAGTGFKGITAPSPSGDAKRGDYSLRKETDGTIKGDLQSGPGSVRIYANDDNNRTELLNSLGQVVLYLEDQSEFATISGRIYFDDAEYQNGNGPLDSSIAHIRVRLSSEGECFYDNTVANLVAVAGSPNSYHYFEYKCYIGKSWWGNVGLLIDNSVNGPLASPTICIGNPDFNGGVSNNTLTSAHPVPSNTRTYRGFTGTLTSGTCANISDCLSTGIDAGGNIPNDGTVIPGIYITGTPANGAYNQHFLFTRLTGNETCTSKMTSSPSRFASNAGKYYCISPDSDTHDDICPNVWPTFTVAGGGGVTNFDLTVNMSGPAGIVSSSPTGISCDISASCTSQQAAYPSGSVVTLTPAAPIGYTFSTWSGACSGSNLCTVTLSGNITVGAVFTSGTTSNLAVTVNPSGSGTVTSVDGTGTPDGNINCPTTCSHDYTTSGSVTLHAVANTGYTFTGWSGGGCTGTSNCTVTMNSAQSVTATFAATVTNYTLAVNKSGTGSGTVTSNPAGINCGSTCSNANIAQGTTVTLTAAAGSTDNFIKWTGVTCSETTGNGANQTQSNTQTTCTFTMTGNQTVTAQFDTTLCVTTIAGTRRDAASSMSVTAPVSCTSCSCNNDSAGTGYSCSVTAVSNSSITVTDTWTGHSPLTKNKNVTANCQNNTNVNIN